MKHANRKIPIGRCPNCGSAVIYSDNGADKLRFTVIRAGDDYKGQTYLCAKCKTMVAVTEKRTQGVSIPATANA